MIRSSIFRSVPCVLIGLFAAILCPSAAQEKWHSQADELPGMVSTKTLVAVGAAALLVTAVILVASHSGDADGESAKADSSARADAAGADSSSTTQSSGRLMGVLDLQGSIGSESRLRSAAGGFTRIPVAIGLSEDQIVLGWTLTF